MNKVSALEAAARALPTAWPEDDFGSFPKTSEAMLTDLRAAAQRCILAYLTALVEDEETVDALAGAMLSRDAEIDAVTLEWKVYTSFARAALRSLLERAKGQIQ